MYQKLKGNKKGFTIAELLIVLAIVAVLAAIAIPLFGAQLDRAEQRVNQSNARAAASIATAQYMLDDLGSGGADTYYFLYDGINIESTTQASAEITVNMNPADGSEGKIASVDITAAASATGEAASYTVAQLGLQ